MATWCMWLTDLSMAVMRPYVRWLWPLAGAAAGAGCIICRWSWASATSRQSGCQRTRRSRCSSFKKTSMRRQEDECWRVSCCRSRPTTLRAWVGAEPVTLLAYQSGWLGSRVFCVLDSGAEGPGFRSRPRCCPVTVVGKLFTPVVPLFTKQRNGEQPS